MKSFKILELPLSIFFVSLAVLLYRSTATFPESSQTTTAIYIKALAGALFLLGIANFYSVIKAENIPLKYLFQDTKKFFILLFLLISYVFFIGRLGFISSTVAFTALGIYLMGYKKVLNLVLISIGITAFVYILFHEMFKISLPTGILF